MKKILVVFGTRPEAIKLAPVIWELRRHPEAFHCRLCVTAQHRQMLDQVLTLFNIQPDIDLNIMTDNQSLPDLTAHVLKEITPVMEQERPDLVLIQGDTTTTFATALAAYYQHIPVAHVEAGLRTGDKYNPFPEELNRRLCSVICEYHFCPTEGNRRQLLAEGVSQENIFVTGNTVVDCLEIMLEKLRSLPEEHFTSRFPDIHFDRQILLVTGHRRESFGHDFENICMAIREIALRYPQVEIVYPAHLNPNVQSYVYSLLADVENIHLLEPLDYATFIWMMKKSFLILTDSGGILEEAPTLKKPVIIMRKITERPEAVESGFAILAGTTVFGIVEATEKLMHDVRMGKRLKKSKNPFGDGKAAQRIVQIFRDKLLC
ncbi:MAG: UDP-N-acetylglucosamine 2-epimerase (non-hydrolyzing) [Calditrichaeota bacterium]|nr:MAG: UDP-N-acetylglucosamine 2-epimerase (non-hydrolyzing) [Calditrichota bacterium]